MELGRDEHTCSGKPVLAEHRHLRSITYISSSQGGVPGPASSAPPEAWLEMQIPGPPADPLDQKRLGRALPSAF